MVDELLILRRTQVPLILRKASKILEVNWLLSTPRWIKLNSNVAFSNGKGGYRGVFWTSDGWVQGSFMVRIRALCAFEAELSIVIFALELVEHFGWDFVWLESNSDSVIHLFSSRTLQVPWFLCTYWLHFLCFLDSICFQDSHIYRESNQVVDLHSKAYFVF